MSILGQTKMIAKVTEGIDFRNKLIDLVREINQCAGFLTVNEEKVGMFKSVMVIVEKEVSDECV